MLFVGFLPTSLHSPVDSSPGFGGVSRSIFFPLSIPAFFYGRARLGLDLFGFLCPRRCPSASAVPVLGLCILDFQVM